MTQLTVERVQPVQVHVVQVVAAHGLRQLLDVDVSGFCHFLARTLDVLPLVGVKHFFGLLCSDSEQEGSEENLSVEGGELSAQDRTRRTSRTARGWCPDWPAPGRPSPTPASRCPPAGSSPLATHGGNRGSSWH